MVDFFLPSVHCPSLLYLLTWLATNTPGPQDYDPILPQSGPAFSILSRSAQKGKPTDENQNLFYDTTQCDLIFESAPKYSISAKLEDSIRESGPGPLDYKINGLFGTESKAIPLKPSTPRLRKYYLLGNLRFN